MSTPYLDEAERCSRVALLHEGRLLASDEPSRLRAMTRGTMVEIVADRASTAVELVRRVPGVADAQLFGERLHVTLTDTGDDAVTRFIQALRGTPLESAAVRPVAPSLEDVFIAQLAAHGARS
jgi:ABC-2 type transport system ATP-binding protein